MILGSNLLTRQYPEGSYDFNDHTELPLPRLSDDQHGTRCAGEIAAVPNDVCGVGVAYGAKVAGVRILSAPISDADEAAALNYEYQLNDIYSCSWGPPDDGRSMEGPEGLILKAMVNGVQRGRSGKGSIFVFAAGNGGGADDQCNFDGYTNSIFSLSIGAMDRKGLHPYYSELCAAMIAVAPSSGSGDHIVSCLRVFHYADSSAHHRCWQGQVRSQPRWNIRCSPFGCRCRGSGPSSPVSRSQIAIPPLILSRPELTWRDIQHLVVRTAVYFNDGDPDWEETAAKRQFSYKCMSITRQAEQKLTLQMATASLMRDSLWKLPSHGTLSNPRHGSTRQWSSCQTSQHRRSIPLMTLLRPVRPKSPKTARARDKRRSMYLRRLSQRTPSQPPRHPRRRSPSHDPCLHQKALSSAVMECSLPTRLLKRCLTAPTLSALNTSPSASGLSTKGVVMSKYNLRAQEVSRVYSLVSVVWMRMPAGSKAGSLCR